MSKDKTSETKQDSFILEDLFGIGGHYKTTISDGDREAVGLGRTPQEAENIASEYWEKKNGDDDD